MLKKTLLLQSLLSAFGSISASILNLFNARAPEDWGTYGGGTAPYNPLLHLQGAVGRFFNVGLKYTF